jgi:pyruvate/2-oxoglutarate dehydrogenase complex dihydrolipoamide dehydrogenase (E3) component
LINEQELKFKVGKFPFSANGKALASGEPEGFVKLIIAEPHGEAAEAYSAIEQSRYTPARSSQMQSLKLLYRTGK